MSDYEELNLIELENQIKILRERNQKLEKENIEMKTILEENGLGNESSRLSEAEFICLQQLRLLKEQSEIRPLERDEVNMLDLLHKNLLMARNIPIVKKAKDKKKSVEELLKIVQSPSK